MENTTHSHILQIQEAMKQNRLVVFVGAGASASVGVPTWGELIRSFQQELPREMYDSADPLKTAEAYRELRGDVEYLAHVKKVLKNGETSSGAVHEAIMDLDPCHIVTTNYDDLLEQAAIHSNKQYYVVAKDDDLPLNKGEKMIIKMHGDFANNNIVLTENDYYDYSQKFPLINSFLLSLFATKVVLFVGFSFNDINLKYILRQVSNMLGEKMQRVYLLTDEKKDALAYSYYKRKMVQLLSISEETSSEIIKSQKIDLDEQEEELTGKTKALYQALRVIKKYDAHYDSLIDSATDLLSQYQEQIRYWGKYLERLSSASTSTSKRITIDGTSLLLDKHYQKQFKELIQKKQNAPSEYALRKDEIDWIKQKLYENGIESIDDIPLFTEKQISWLTKARHNELSETFYCLNVIDMEYILSRLTYKPLTYTIDDLELPFLQYRIGEYYEAYKTYKALAPEMWRHRKYVLYFLCLYNMKAAYIYSPMEMLNARKDVFKESDYLKKIQLKEILEALPIEKNVKGILGDLVNGVLLKEQLIISTELKDKLSEQRERAERGGTSLNGDIVQLLNEFVQAFNFCNENYILNESFSNARNAYVKMGEGLINSVMTPTDEIHVQSKINELPEISALLFVFHIKPSELQRILGLAKGKKIPVEYGFKKRLKTIVDNLADDLQLNTNRRLVSSRLVEEYVENILLLQNAISDPLPIPELYKVVAAYWGNGINKGDGIKRAFLRIMGKQKPSPAEAIGILKSILPTRIFHETQEANLIGVLANIAKEENLVIENFPNYQKLSNRQNIICVASYYNALPQEDKLALKTYIRGKVTHICDLLLAEIHSEAHYVTSELLITLFHTLKEPHKNYLETEALSCSLLVGLLHNENYHELHETILKLCDQSECLRFMCSPEAFSPIENICGSWLVSISDEQLKKLYEHKEIRKIALQYCEKNKWDTSLKDKMIRFAGE